MSVYKDDIQTGPTDPIQNWLKPIIILYDGRMVK